jgi:dipeptide/tripeptide permease
MAASFGTLLAAPTIASHPSWLTSAIVLSSLSEVLISTVGLAQVAKLAPRNQISLYMSIWLLTVAIGAKVAGMVGSRLPLRGSFAVLLGLTLIASVATLLLRRRLDVATALAVPPVVFRPTKSTADGVPQHAT